ncbi:mitochondrial carrier domain-containing protein [Cladochytrium replicatum]|nr:mitochondrial carrier domain-containing protein [Cladochytrium replicatum]
MASSLNFAGDKGPLIPALYPKKGKPRKMGEIEKFLCSGAAPATAVLFTNPFDTAKVRLQLQGEQVKSALRSATSETEAAELLRKTQIYKNSFDTIGKIYTNEGLAGLQKGILPAVLREGSKNVFRLGMYDPIMGVLHDPKNGSAPAWKRVIAGSLCGVMGAFACNPFELVKTRLQSSAAGKIAVGHQHQYSGVWDALKKIVQKDGFTGLYRGSVLSMGRSIVGSGTNLASFTMMKEWLILNRGWKDDWVNDMVSGLGSSIISVIFMNPIDVARTRYYNQPYENGKGVMYTSSIDAVQKIARNEGFSAFYKGVTTHFLRIGPHFCFTFVFLGVYRRWFIAGYDYLDMRDSFKLFDSNKDGALDIGELRSALKAIVAREDAAKVGAVSDGDYEALISRCTSRLKDANGDIKWKDYPAFVGEVKKVVTEIRGGSFNA